MGLFDIVPPPPADQPQFSGPPANFNIVPPAPAQQYQFVDPSTQPQEPAPQSNKHYSIFQRLMGVDQAREWADKQAHVKYLMQEIHSGLTDPNSRIPDYVVTKMTNELGSLINHPEAAAAIKTDVAAKLAAKKAQKSLAHVNATQDQSQRGLGTPAIPPAGGMAAAMGPTSTPAPAGPASTPVAGQTPIQGLGPNLGSQAKPPGLPVIPFGSGGQSGGPAPLTNEPPAMKAMADSRGLGNGIVPPPPANPPVFQPPPPMLPPLQAQPSAPAPAPMPVPARRMAPGGFNMDILSRAQLGQEQAQQQAPILRSTAAIEREQMPLDYQARAAMLENDPDYKNAAAFQRLSLKSGKPIAAAPFHNVSGTTPAGPNAFTIDGQPVKEGTPGTYHELGDQRFFQPASGRWTKTTVLQPDGTSKVFSVNSTTNEVTQPGGGLLTGAAKARPIKVTHADGTTTEEMIGPTGQWMSSDPRLAGFNPMMLPSTADHVQLVDQPNGDKAIYVVTTSSGKVPGASAAPAGGATGVGSAKGGAVPTATAPAKPAARIGAPTIVGGKSLTPEQRINEENKANVYDETIRLASSVKSKLGLIKGVLDKKIIQWQTDPTSGMIKGFINQNVGTPEQHKLAGDIISLNEAINSARIPLGAGGFKSKESYQALRALGLNIQANTSVSGQVLDNTIRLLTGQRDTIMKGLQGKGLPSQPNQLPSPGAVAPEDETEDQKIERLTKKHG